MAVMTASRSNERLAAAVTRLEGRLSHLGSSLYALESSLGVTFARSQVCAGGSGGQAALEVRDGLAEVWTRYPVARDHVQRLVAAAAAGRRAYGRGLLRSDATTLPSGSTTSIEHLLDTLQKQVDAVAARADQLAERTRRSLVLLDSSTTAFVPLLDRAKAVGAERDVEVLEAQRQLDQAVAAVAGDATVELDGRLERAIGTARRRIEQLERQREALPAQLVSARLELDEIRRLVTSGAAALAVGKEKISEPKGLCEGLDPSGLERGDRGLGPWLARLEDEAASGGWRTAAGGVEQWRKLALRWLTGAHHVLVANQAPLGRRNELRGLLQASQAQAAVAGQAEEPRLIELGRAAEEALYVAPCDLDRAEARVLAYVDAVRDGTEDVDP